MTEPILVVDIGAASSAAAIVADGRTALLRDPLTRSEAWPSALLLDDMHWLAGTAAERRKRAAPRRYVDDPRRALDTRTPLWLEHHQVTGVEALTAYLSVIAGEARAVYGSPIRRLVLTVPGGYAVPDPRRDDLIAVGEGAGFTDVELVDDALAVALDPHTAVGLPTDCLVLVCDLGVTWNVGCVRLHGEHGALLSRRSAPTGRDLDVLLLDDLRSAGRAWLDPLLATPGDAGLRAYHDAVDFVRRLKHRLADAEEVQDHLTPVTPAYQLTRQSLGALAGPVVETLVASCHAVVEEAGVTLADLGAVVLAGGAARLPMTVTALGEALGHPPRRSPGPEFAAVRGAARWAAGTTHRAVAASAPGWRTTPVVWDVPGSRARLLRWTVAPESRYPAGTVLAEIRTADDLIVGLTAADSGALREPLPSPGALVGPVLAVAARRLPEALLAVPPVAVRTHQGADSFLLSADVLLECGAGGSSVTSRAVATGDVRNVFTPEPTDLPASRQGGRLFVDPEGRPALLAWDAETGVSVFDVRSGKLTTRIGEAVGGRRFLVDEAGWRVAVESEGRAAVGRYRRSTVTVWDLHTGGRLDRATDGGWEQRHPEFRERSAADGFGPEAVSPDGGLTATVRADAVLLTDVASGVEVFHTALAADARAWVAFDADGQLLLINTESAGRSRVDVLQV